ncbi:MAG: hypothetical protein HYV17_04075 [Xanthomonadales bacterium]|nr:hypothetical protein [Xanthomonadales bacterium]
MATLLVLLAPGVLVALASFLVSRSKRRAVRLAGTILLAAALLIIAAVNLGWVSP